MKKVLMLDSNRICGSGDTTEGKIYKVIEDYLYMPDYEDLNDEANNRDGFQVEYNKENLIKYPDAQRWITIEDDSSTDSFEVFEDDDRLIILENDNELAHALIDRIDGLGSTIVKMAEYFRK